jgi:alpha-mannosidase
MKLGNSTVDTLDIQTPQISVLAGGRDMNEEGILTHQGGDTHFTQRFALKPHGEYDPVTAMRFALEHQNPLITGQVTGPGSYPETSFSLLSIDNPEVLLWALKPADDGTQAGIVARVWNLSAQPAEFSLRWNTTGLDTAIHLTHIETPVAVASVQDHELLDSLNQQQLKTYALFPAGWQASPGNAGLPPEDIAQEAATVAPTGAQETPTHASGVTGSEQPEQPGCLPGLLAAVLSLFR